MTRVLVCALCVLATAAPARAATSAQVRALAHAAETSPRALAQLRAIDVVDGAPMSLARALRTTDRTELRARLRALAGVDAAGPAPQFAPRARARHILRGRRFHASPVPRPFHRPLVWLGDKLRPVQRGFDWLAGRVPGGSWTLWLLLAALVVTASAVVAGRIAHRRAVLELELGARGSGPVAQVDPRALERAADEAEAAGDAARALRLRFRAGLLRLGRAEVVPLRESLTSGEARRLLRLPEFDGLARTHDEVVYGGRTARREDAADARERWPRVLAAKGVRT